MAKTQLICYFYLWETTHYFPNIFSEITVLFWIDRVYYGSSLNGSMQLGAGITEIAMHGPVDNPVATLILILRPTTSPM